MLPIFTEKKKKKIPTILIEKCDQDMKKCYSKVPKNISEYDIGQIALIKYTEGTPANTKGTIGARFKRKITITLYKTKYVM